MRIDSVYPVLEEAQALVRSVHRRLENSGVDLNAAKPILQGESLNGLFRMFDLAAPILLAIRPTDELAASAVAVNASYDALNGNVTAIRNHIKKVDGRLQAFGPEGTTIQDANGNLSFRFAKDGTQTNSWDATGHFQQIYVSTINLVAALAGLMPFAGSSEVAVLSDQLHKLVGIIAAADSQRALAEKNAKDAADHASAAAARVKSIQDLEEVVKTASSRIDAIQQQVTKDQVSVATALSSTEAITAKAASLEQQILGYSAKFDSFQAQLDQRNAEMDRLATIANETEARNAKREVEIDRLTSESDAMLRGATNAGLSESLEKTRRRYEVRMYVAQVGFVVAAIALFVSVVPIAASLVPGIFGGWFDLQPAPDRVSSDTELLSQIAGRLLWLAPLTWLTYFCSKLQSQFFQLEREYGHKAALARSVEGFRRQADKFQEEIAMAVFLEIRSNPASSPAPDPIEHPMLAGGQKLLDWFKDRAVGRGPATPPGGG